MNGHGGKRAGAGAKKKDRGEQDFYQDAESYLMAVVQGLTAPDAVRVQAAKTLIAYQQAKQRVPVRSKTPAQLHEQSISSVEKAKGADFEKKAAKIRSKFTEKETL